MPKKAKLGIIWFQDNWKASLDCILSSTPAPKFTNRQQLFLEQHCVLSSWPQAIK